MFVNFNFPISLNSLKHSFCELSKKTSICRLIHNYFLKSITIENNTIDLGSTKKNSSYKYINTENIKNLDFSDKYNHNENNNVFKNDFELGLNLKSNIYDNVILFNVIEHIENHKNLIKEINRILKINGKLELFVPFLYEYHEDPVDIFRPTHFYLKKILDENNFSTKIYFIGSGPFTVVANIICPYLYFTLLKIPFFYLCLILDKIRFAFSKKKPKMYLGLHATCIKK